MNSLLYFIKKISKKRQLESPLFNQPTDITLWALLTAATVFHIVAWAIAMELQFT